MSPEQFRREMGADLIRDHRKAYGQLPQNTTEKRKEPEIIEPVSDYGSDDYDGVVIC